MRWQWGSLCLLVSCFAPGSLAAQTPAPAADPLSRVELVALAPAAQRAAIRLPDERLVLVRPGDAVPGTTATVLAVRADRLVLEETLGKTRRRVWMEPSPRPGEPGRLRSLDSRAAAPPLPVPLPAPKTALPPTAAPGSVVRQVPADSKPPQPPQSQQHR